MYPDHVLSLFLCSSACTLRATGSRSSPRCCLIFRCRRTASLPPKDSPTLPPPPRPSGFRSCVDPYMFSLYLCLISSAAREAAADEAGLPSPRRLTFIVTTVARDVAMCALLSGRLRAWICTNASAVVRFTRKVYGDWVSCLGCVVSPVRPGAMRAAVLLPPPAGEFV